LDLGTGLVHIGEVNFRPALTLGILLLVPGIGWAQVYRWQDDRGTLHFTNAPERVPETYRSHVGPLPPASESTVAPAREEPVATARGVTRIPFSPGAPIIVSATISGAPVPVTLILDTGADRTVIAPQTLWRLGISTSNAPRAQIRGVTGAGQGEVVQVASVEVGEAKVGPLRIIAHDADLRQAEGLLGRDFLEQFTVTIDAREQIVTLAPK
jgi:hypothetical protein